MNIITVFAGRRNNLEILGKYLQDALDLKIIDEVHYWNNTRNIDDEEYLKTISNLKRCSSAGAGNYISITPPVVDNSFELYIKAPNDAHIKIVDDIEYEIVLGGWSNTISVIRENGEEIFILRADNIVNDDLFNNFEIKIIDNVLHILKNEEIIISQKIRDNFQIKNILFKTGHGSVGHLEYETTKNNGFYFMDTCEKNWENYYKHYNNGDFENDIILKCDDDILFIDLYKLPNFINFIKKNDYDLVFANTINNGVSAYFQQNKFGLIPKKIMNFEYPNGNGNLGFGGSLWESGKKAENLHNYFIQNHEKFLNYDYDNENIQIFTRFSINFFGYKGKKWNKICSAGLGCDEYNLTEDYVQHRNFKNILYTDFYVSHLSFYRQVNEINTKNLIMSYHKFYDTVKNRFLNPQSSI